MVAFAILLYSSSAFVFLFRPEAQNHPDGDPVVQLFWYPLYAAVAWFLLARRQEARKSGTEGIPRVDPVLVVFLVVAAMSVLWSGAPALTARRVAALIATGMCGQFLAASFSITQILKLFRVVVLVTAAASVVLLLVAPHLAADPLVGSGNNVLRGVFIAKNLFGRMLALGLCAELLLFLFARGRLAFHAAAVLLLLPLLVLSGSATSLVVLALVAGVIVFCGAARRTPGSATGVLLLISSSVVAFVGFFSGRQTLLHLVGRDSSLSNRTRIWHAVLDAIHAKPLLGYGYGAFWRGSAGPSRLVNERLHAQIAHGHNGFLDTWGQVGFVGLVVAIVLLVRLLWRSLVQVARGDVLRGATAFGFLAFLILFNIDESTLLLQNSIYTVLLFYVAALCQKAPTRAEVEVDRR